MRALSIYLGGDRICTAGAGDEGSTTAEVSINFGSSDNSIFLHVTGNEGVNGVTLKWCLRSIGVGDEVRIVVEETDKIDMPIERRTYKETQEWARNLGKKNLTGGESNPDFPSPPDHS